MPVSKDYKRPGIGEKRQWESFKAAQKCFQDRLKESDGCDHRLVADELADGLDSLFTSFSDFDNLGDDWVKLDEQKFTVFIANSIQHVATNFCSTPQAHLSDQCVDLVWARTTSKAKLVDMMDQLEDGKYTLNDAISTRKVHAFVLHPRPHKDGHVTVDGERAAYAPTAMQVHSGVLRVFGDL